MRNEFCKLYALELLPTVLISSVDATPKEIEEPNSKLRREGKALNAFAPQNRLHLDR